MGCEGCDVNTNDSAHQSLIADVVRPAGKVVVFGIPKRHDKVYTVLVDNAKPDTLIPVIRQKIMPDGIVCTDSLSSYGKPDVSGFGVVCGRGRNPTLRLWPTIFSGKIDVFPGDRRSRLISSMTSVAPA